MAYRYFTLHSQGMFKGLALFDKPLNRWNVSKVVSFKDLFEGDIAFGSSFFTGTHPKLIASLFGE